MSGHEKFYIPHDDLQELKTAIESLETAIDTLDADLKIFNNAFLLASTQTSENFDHTLDGVTDTTQLLLNEVLDADDDRYLQSLTVALTNPDGEIATRRDSGVLIAMSDGVSINYFAETVFKNDSQCMNYGDADWYFYKTYDLKQARVPAGGTLVVLMIMGKLRDKTQINISIMHVKMADVS